MTEVAKAFADAKDRFEGVILPPEFTGNTLVPVFNQSTSEAREFTKHNGSGDEEGRREANAQRPRYWAKAVSPS